MEVGSSMMDRGLALVVVVFVVVAGVPFADASEQRDLDQDLSEVVPAGEYRAYVVTLEEPGWVKIGGTYEQVSTEQPVLPLLVMMDDLGSGAGVAGALFGYDRTGFFEPAAVEAQVAVDGDGDRVRSYDATGVRLGGWTTGQWQAGTYLLLVATAPAEGEAEITIQVPSSATVDAAQKGASFFSQSIQASAVGFDTFARGGVPGLAGPDAQARAWYHSGAEVPFEVEGAMYGHVGYWPTEARWVSPSGEEVPTFVVDGEPGSWTASFPEAYHVGPVCVPSHSCSPAFGDTRNDPPFVIGVDVGITAG